jgi:hypothetical protein
MTFEDFETAFTTILSVVGAAVVAYGFIAFANFLGALASL